MPHVIRYNAKKPTKFAAFPKYTNFVADVRYAEITSSNSTTGVRFESATPFEINALPWTPEELETHDHVYKLPQSNQTVARINYKQMGVGGDDSWGAPTHAEYTLPANRAYHFTFTVKPV
ncbi:Beta-galactosidase [compost metagenome]